jgi:hypothetical protein
LENQPNADELTHSTQMLITMRKIIPIIFVAATLLVGCKSATMSTTTAATNSVAGTNAAAATPPAPVGPNTPAQTLSEDKMLGDFAGVFFVILTFAAVKRC